MPFAILGLLAVLIGAPALLAFAPVFTVASIAVPGASAATGAAVRAALRGEQGRPLGLVSDADVATAMARVPVVETFAVVRRPPSTLEIRVTERTAVLQEQGVGGWRRLDAARVAIGTSATRTPGLPVVAVPRGPAGAGAYRAAVAAVAALRADGPVPDRVQATSADDVDVLVGPHRVRWGGAENGARKAEALRAALVTVGRGVTEIDVSSPGVVRTR